MQFSPHVVQALVSAYQRLFEIWQGFAARLRYDTIEEFNVDSKAEYTA